MGMFDGFWFRGRAIAQPGRNGVTATRLAADRKAGGEVFDEFGAPEGGFGRLEAFLDDTKAAALQAGQQARAPVQDPRHADYALGAPGSVAP